MKIVQYPHPALRRAARPLTAIDRAVRLQAGRMLELMYGSHGLGLAGNQVAWPFQMFVMNPKSDPQRRDLEQVLINPVIVERKGSVEGEEGCLSFPELYQKVRRNKSVRVQAYNLEGKSVEIVSSSWPDEVAELTSRLLQHEIDHLHGVLFIDKMGTIAKLASRSALKDFERTYRLSQQRGDLPPDPAIEAALSKLQQDGPPPPEEPAIAAPAVL
jgi:peptide deformylase